MPDNPEEKIKEILGICDLSIDPYDIAAFMPEEGKMLQKGNWRMVFLMKSGQTIKCGYMNEVCFRSWKHKLQLLFEYIHPGKIEEWKVKHGFTGYLDGLGVTNKKVSEEIEKAEKPKKSIKDLFNK